MNRPVVVVLGVFATVAASAVGLVVSPETQLSSRPVGLSQADGTEVVYPAPLDDWRAAPGRAVYRSLGCMYCHSQQVRPQGFGSDLERGWGARRSAPRDYIFDAPPLLGTMRTGPDLSNIGGRQPSAEWHYLHLYQPTITSPGSNMAPFPFLFDRYDERPPPSNGIDSIELPDGRGFIVPRRRALQLVAYLLGLEQKHKLEDVL